MTNLYEAVVGVEDFVTAVLKTVVETP